MAMTASRRTVTVVGLLSLLAGVAILAASPAVGLRPDAHGWWWKGQPDAVPVKVPAPLVPTGGLFVASDVTGASAVSAVRFTIPSGQEADKLTLLIANVEGTPLIRLCPVSGTWTPADGGSFGTAPTYDCAKATIGSVSSSNDAVSFFADDVQAGQSINVVAVPVPDAQGLYPTFAVSFFPPDTNTLSVAGGAEVPPPPPPPPPAAPPVGAPVAPPITVAPPQPAASVPPTVSVVPQALPLQQRSGLDDAARIALLLLLALGAMMALSGRARERPPRLLGALAGGRLASARAVTEAPAPVGPSRGIGRFSRPREGAAPRL